MNELDRWLDAVCPVLEIDRAIVQECSGPLLDMVRDTAHGVSRPAAPLTAFLVGLAAGAAGARSDGGAPATHITDQLARVGDLVRDWEPQD